MKFYKKRAILYKILFIIAMCSSCSKKEKIILNREPFVGNVQQYVYATEEGRDREWEEDIIFFAKTLLNRSEGHPLLKDYPCNILTENSIMDGNSGPQLGKFYNHALQKEVIEQIDIVLASIPALEDYEITYKLQEILYSLNDIHTHIRVKNDYIYPFQTIPIFNENIDFYLIEVPKENEELLYSKLEKINGVPIREVMEKFENIVPHENEYSFITNLNDRLFKKDALKYIGVGNEEKIRLTVSDKDGKRRTISQKAIHKDEMEHMELVSNKNKIQTLLKDSHDEKEYYWYEYLEEKDTIYMRYAECELRDDIKFVDMIEEIKTIIETKDGIVKFIIDLRGNPGGQILEGFSSFIRWLQKNQELTGKVYVMIDEMTSSGAIISAALIRKNVDNVVLIGNGGKQSPNFFAGSMYKLKNNDITFLVSSVFYNVWPEYEEETLMPDILVTPTIEDYMNGIDTELEAVLND